MLFNEIVFKIKKSFFSFIGIFYFFLVLFVKNFRKTIF